MALHQGTVGAAELEAGGINETRKHEEEPGDCNAETFSMGMGRAHCFRGRSDREPQETCMETSNLGARRPAGPELVASSLMSHV